MKIGYRRLVMILSAVMVGIACVLFLSVIFRKNIRYFVTPSQIISEDLYAQKHLRLGAVVKEGSWKRHDLDHTFILTDGAHEVHVIFHGMVPELFRENQTIVVEGMFQKAKGDADGDFEKEEVVIKEGAPFFASAILAKHDENYKPPMGGKQGEKK